MHIGLTLPDSAAFSALAKSLSLALVSAAGHLVKIGVIYLFARIVGRRIIDRIGNSIALKEPEERRPRVRTLQTLLKSILDYVLWFVVGVMLLSAFNVDPKPVLASAGVIGLAVGFGAQRLVRDVISGFFILLENQYSVGDYVTIGAVNGIVLEVGMRMTRIRSDDGKLYLVSNGDVTIVCNHSREPISTFIDLTVANGQDLDRIISLLNQLGIEYASDKAALCEPFKYTGISAVNAAGVTLRMTGKATPPSVEGVQLGFREAVLELFSRENIKLA